MSNENINPKADCRAQGVGDAASRFDRPYETADDSTLEGQYPAAVAMLKAMRPSAAPASASSAPAREMAPASPGRAVAASRPGTAPWSGALAGAAVIALLLAAPLYYRVFIAPVPSVHPLITPVPHPAALDPAALDPSLAWLQVDNQLMRQQQLQVFSSLVGESDFEGKNGLARGALARLKYDSDLSDRVKQLLSAPADAVPVRLSLDEAVLLHGWKLRQRRELAPGRGLVVVNATPPPSRQDDEPEFQRYLLARSAAERMGSLFGIVPVSDLSDEAHQHLGLLAQPGAAWPDAFRQGVADAAAGTAQVLLISVEAVASDFCRGTVDFTLLDVARAKAAATEQVAFFATPAPLPLRKYFPSQGNSHGQVQVTAGRDAPDEMVITFTGANGLERQLVSLLASEPLAVEDRFSSARMAAEIHLEAQASFSGGGDDPPVQFMTGGNDDVFSVGSPPEALGPHWRRITIPVDLRQVKRWKTGLTVACGTLPPGERLVVRVRNAYVRPLTAPATQPARPPDEIGPAYTVFDDRSLDFHWAGLMPDGQGIAQEEKFADKPHEGKVCYRARYQLERQPWVAVASLLDAKWEPQRNFNMFDKLKAKPGDAIRVRFFARSPDKATVQFKVGGVKGDSVAFEVATDWIELTPQWTRYEIDLTDKPDRPVDLSALRAALIWSMDREHNAIGDKKIAEVQIDNVYYTRIQAPK